MTAACLNRIPQYLLTGRAEVFGIYRLAVGTIVDTCETRHVRWIFKEQTKYKLLNYVSNKLYSIGDSDRIICWKWPSKVAIEAVSLGHGSHVQVSALPRSRSFWVTPLCVTIVFFPLVVQFGQCSRFKKIEYLMSFVWYKRFSEDRLYSRN